MAYLVTVLALYKDSVVGNPQTRKTLRSMISVSYVKDDLPFRKGVLKRSARG